MKNSNLQKLVEILTFLNVPYSVIEDTYVLCCSEAQYLKLVKVLVFFCTEFKIQPTKPIDHHFEVIYIVIPFSNILS